MADVPHLDPRTVAHALGGEAHGQQVSAPSPGHSRKDRSLSIAIDDNAPGGFVVHSFVGDNALAVKDYVREKIGEPAWKPNGSHARPALAPPKVVTNYDYLTAAGEKFLRVTRLSDKSFRQSRWNGQAWISGKPVGAPPIPYRLPELLASSDDPVFVVEGEKDADRLTSLGLVATTNSGGAGRWTADMSEWLKGRDVFILPDNDDVGRAHAQSIKATLPHATILNLDGLPPKGDVSDWLDAGNAVNDLVGLALTPPEPFANGPLLPTAFEWIEPQHLPKRQWLYGRHLIRRYVSATIAPGGIGKSSLVIVEALAMASGKPILGEAVSKPLNVWYWNGEDGQDENRYRTVAAASHHGLRPDDFARRLWQDSGREKELLLATQGQRGSFEINGALIQELIAHIQALKIDVLIIDPFVAAHEVSENDNGPINAVIRALGRVAEFGNCAIELVHHIRKPGAGIVADTDVNDARGASALIGGVRSARVLNVMSEDEATALKIVNRLAYFRVDNGKANLAPRSDVAVWRRIVGYDLHNYDDNQESDSIGVVEKFEMPGIFANTPPDAMRQAQHILSTGSHRYDQRAKDWAGYAVAEMLGISVTDDKGKRRIAKIIDKWIETGAVQKYDALDEQRKPKAFVRAESYYETED